LKSIVVLGSANVDLVTRSHRLPHGGETIHGESFAIHSGGKGANQAVAAARLGAPVTFLTVFGNDSFAETLRCSLIADNVHIDATETRESSSGIALINTDDYAQNQIVVIGGANALVDEAYVIKQRHHIEDASVLLLQLEIPMATVVTAARIAHGAGVKVILDPAPVVRLPEELLQCITWITPNQIEAEALLTHHQMMDSPHAIDILQHAEACANALLKPPVQNVLLKLGEHGIALAQCSGVTSRFAAFPVTAVDTTAAGDAFNGAFAVALSEGKMPVEAARWAAVAAALSVSKHGAQPSLPYRQEVEEYLRAEQLISR
jgi:ribokinase